MRNLQKPWGHFGINLQELQLLQKRGSNRKDLEGSEDIEPHSYIPLLGGLYMQPGAFEIFISLTSFALFLIIYGMTYLKCSVLRPPSWDWGRGWRSDMEIACQFGGEMT